MDLISLTSSAYQLRGGSNAGLIAREGRAVLVDTGLDRDAAKKILRHVESLRMKLAAVVITHAHADHFGGAAIVRARTGAPVYAPALEAAVVANPLLEPLYLFSGAAPIAELRHKFTLAEACVVDRILDAGDMAIDGVELRVIPAPGHAPNQMMIAGGDVCFVADACFAPEVLDKHGIPFYVDVDQTAATLSALRRSGWQFRRFCSRPWAGGADNCALGCCKRGAIVRDSRGGRRGVGRDRRCGRAASQGCQRPEAGDRQPGHLLPHPNDRSGLSACAASGRPGQCEHG